ncbi:hypothetical protein A9974_28880 [Achromobacter sp. UMC71]|nr:hypothetical protein [Achromobacter sp. UMC71]
MLILVRVRFALVGSGFLVGPQSGGGAVMGGAAGTDLLMLTVSRAAHQALRIDVERHRIRAGSRPASIGWIFTGVPLRQAADVPPSAVFW